VAKKKTAAKKFPSHSTPGHEMDLGTWLVELALTRKNCGVKLPPRFWSLVQYKFAFMREIKAVKKFIKEYGEKAVLRIALREYLTTYTDYGQMEVFLQKIKESAERLALPKDTSEVKPESLTHTGPDLRDEKPKMQKKLGTFERLKELQNGSQ
jgi:hypothetical protein